MNLFWTIYLSGVIAALCFIFDYERNYRKNRFSVSSVAAIIVMSGFSWLAFLDFVSEFKDYYCKRWKTKSKK